MDNLENFKSEEKTDGEAIDITERIGKGKMPLHKEVIMSRALSIASELRHESGKNVQVKVDVLGVMLEFNAEDTIAGLMKQYDDKKAVI